MPLQDVADLVHERDELLQRVDSADSVFHEQHQRFSEVLVLLSKTLAIPDPMLLRLSEPDVQEFERGLAEVCASHCWILSEPEVCPVQEAAGLSQLSTLS